MHYHVTARRNIESILSRGLLTDAEGWNAGYVWFFDDIDIAFQAASLSWGRSLDNVVIAIDTEGLDVIPDPHPGFAGRFGDHAFAVAHSIPAERLTVLETVTA